MMLIIITKILLIIVMRLITKLSDHNNANSNNKEINKGPFQKFWMWHLKDRKLIFYVKGKDEIMKVEIIKERDKGFMCLM